MINRKKFFLNIILPSLLTQGLFIALIFAVIVPNFEDNLIEAKKEMIKEIIYSGISVTDYYFDEAAKGNISMGEARNMAVKSIESIRYGAGNKDYIWIMDKIPVMIMHPYRKDLNGKNVAEFTDPNGKRMFSEMVSVAEKDGEGFVGYMWQWMDDSNKIVPKISFIKISKKWNWIIGTGVYIEDVKESISDVVSKLIIISLGIFLLISFFLFLLVRRNLKAEQLRTVAENKLLASRERYKALVEASNDGTLMFVDGKRIFNNRIISEIIDKSTLDETDPTLRKLISPDAFEDIKQIEEFLGNDEETLQLETKIINNIKGGFLNVLITFSKVLIANNKGLIIIIKDLTPATSLNSSGLLNSEIAFNVADRLHVGIFRTKAGIKGKIANANNWFIELLGFETPDKIVSINIFNLFDSYIEMREFISVLNTNGYIKNYHCMIKKSDGNITKLSVSAVLVKDKDGIPLYIDGFITEAPGASNASHSQENLLRQYAVSSAAWDMPAAELNLPELPVCHEESTITNALETMDFYGTDALAIKNDNNELKILSIDDIIKQCKNGALDLHAKVSLIAASPGLVFDYSARLIDLLSGLIKNKADYLILNTGTGFKFLSCKELTNVLASNINFLNYRIKNSKSLDDLAKLHRELPAMIEYYNASGGADMRVITQVITKMSDLITEEIINIAVNQCGNPPCDFAFIALGSEGRSEQGLSTDQDNAVIFEDIEDSYKAESAQKYFSSLADIINDLLYKSGYELCPGKIMANNPMWNKPLGTWKKYFKEWITVPEPQSIIDSAVFFDFRLIYGNTFLSDRLRNYIIKKIEATPSFLNQIANMTVNYKLPVSIFGKIQTKTIDEQTDSFNLKNAIRLLVNIIRLYSMKYSLTETNTLERLRILYSRQLISQSFYDEIGYCFRYLMNLQFQSQVRSYKKGHSIGNYIALSDLNPTELANLKNVLGSITNFQSKIKYDFSTV